MKKSIPYFILILFFILSGTGYAQGVWPPNDPWGRVLWNGSVSSDYNTAANWTPPSVPASNAGVTIAKVSNAPILPAFLQVNSLTLEPGVKLNATTISIGSGGYIWLKSSPAQDLYSQLTTAEPDGQKTEFPGSVRVEAGSSLKAEYIKVYADTKITLESTSKTYSSVMIANIEFDSGAQEKVKITYKLYTNKIGTAGVKGGNDLISAPLIGKFDAAFVNANPHLPQHPSNKGEFAFAPYNLTAGAFQNFDINPTNGSTNTGSIPFVPGKGYRSATTNGSVLTFTGFPNMQPVTIEISNTPGDAGHGWNLIGNPYPTYLKFQEFFNLNQDEFETNHKAVYGYNSNHGYTPWNLTNTDENTLITPGQGFFVKAKPNEISTVNFRRSMRTTGTSDDYIVGRPPTKKKALSKLKLSSATNTTLTSVYFIEGTSKGMDPGYDAATFNGVAVDFSIFTNLVESNTKLDLAIQSLPYDDFNDVVVPLGIIAKAGHDLSISIDDLSTIPSNINVYLEDTQTKTLNLLNHGAYTFKPTNDLNGKDRFNIHYSAKTLSLKDIQLIDHLRIYTTTSPKRLFINGQLNKAATANLYDIQGRLVRSKVLNVNSTENSMDISNLSAGVYVVKVNTDKLFKTQKVIIK